MSIRQDMLGNADNFFGAMHHNMSRMGGQAVAISMNELSNHDHSRFSNKNKPPCWQELANVRT